MERTWLAIGHVCLGNGWYKEKSEEERKVKEEDDSKDDSIGRRIVVKARVMKASPAPTSPAMMHHHLTLFTLPTLGLFAHPNDSGAFLAISPLPVIVAGHSSSYPSYLTSGHLAGQCSPPRRLSEELTGRCLRHAQRTQKMEDSLCTQRINVTSSRPRLRLEDYVAFLGYLDMTSFLAPREDFRLGRKADAASSTDRGGAEDPNSSSGRD
ncbi:hypothetical protein GYMLUDRAFT_245392 [Collybiopsis luxurians FD-317 M1]|uniref:Uncharacterized protein n=1 Tax=Collybiopsis luxurians FD-317 M1 TaxID=944289 RepID=A0A0D0B773_9AGAR|nr:hypothetical protein GYMLUDRAFT_245392 [Collybiopsis luxurians FD-317 M1]